MNDTPVFVCKHILNNTRPVLLVLRVEGEWQFLCGGDHNADEIPHVVAIGHLLWHDPTLREIENLSTNWEAQRSEIGGEWKMRPISDSADE